MKGPSSGARADPPDPCRGTPRGEATEIPHGAEGSVSRSETFPFARGSVPEGIRGVRDGKPDGNRDGGRAEEREILTGEDSALPPPPLPSLSSGNATPRVSSSLPERRPPVSPGRSSKFATGPLAQKPLFATFHSQKTVESERQKLLSEFERLRQFLHDQEHVLLGQLEKMEKNISKRQNENITDLSKEIALLNKLIAELEEKIQQPTLEFLKVRRQVSVVTFFLLFQCIYGYRRAVLGVKVLFYSVLNERIAQGDV